jgi:hypothetical protein
VDLWEFSFSAIWKIKITVLSTLIHALSTDIPTCIIGCFSLNHGYFEKNNLHFSHPGKKFFYGKKPSSTFPLMLCGAGIK